MKRITRFSIYCEEGALRYIVKWRKARKISNHASNMPSVGKMEEYFFALYMHSKSGMINKKLSNNNGRDKEVDFSWIYFLVFQLYTLVFEKLNTFFLNKENAHHWHFYTNKRTEWLERTTRRSWRGWNGAVGQRGGTKATWNRSRSKPPERTFTASWPEAQESLKFWKLTLHRNPSLCFILEPSRSPK